MASLPSPTQVAGDHVRLYETYYRRLDPAGTGIIQAGPAAQFLKKSGLNDDLLSKIWDLSDPNGNGYLDRSGLFVAIKLLSLAQHKRDPSLSNILLVLPPPNMGEAPPHPPPPSKAAPPPHPPQPQKPVNMAVWIISPADRTRYDQIFNSLGPVANKIHGNKVRGVMMNSKLPTDILGKIWDLSDMDKDGSLDRAEFSIAMHLIYKVLENNPLPPNGLPSEMISSARRATGGGPVPAPLAPPSSANIQNTPNQGSQSGAPKAPWVVSVADRARYDVMFQNADIDKDGFVNGQEIKGIFLQSGLSQMVLAHIWNLCDMKQTGKLTSEQFALALWLIQRTLGGQDPPSQLSSDMIPPSMRTETTSNVVPAKPQYTNPELQAVADEIDELNTQKLKMEAEIQHKEASIRLKNNEAKNLQTELDTLSATFKQLDHQKDVAQKRLDDLAAQNSAMSAELVQLNEQVNLHQMEVAKLKVQVEEQEGSLLEQEEEVLGKKRELDNLRQEETTLEANLQEITKKVERLTVVYEKTQLQITELRVKVDGIADEELQMTETLNEYDKAILASDASTLSESSLRDPRPEFVTLPGYDECDDTPRATPTPPKVESPILNEPLQNGVTSAEQNDVTAGSKAKDTSFSGGHDPFASAFGGNGAQSDPFSSWDKKQSAPVSQTPVPNDPFGGDAFAEKAPDSSLSVSSGPPPRPESPSPALPPKKVKQPPPRPAPPKKGPPHPAPPKSSSVAESHNGDDGGWGGSGGDGGGFANFADFDTQLTKGKSSAKPRPSSSKTSSNSGSFSSKFDGGSSDAFSPWGDDDPFSKASTNSSGGKDGKIDPFGTPLNSLGSNSKSSPWVDDNFAAPPKTVDKYAVFASPTLESPKDPFGADSFSSLAIKPTTTTSTKEDVLTESFSGFGETSDSEIYGTLGASEDPFGNVDPFKDVFEEKKDKFSWDNEPDPFSTADSGTEATPNYSDNPFGKSLSSSTVSSAVDPFSVSFDSNKNVLEEGSVKSGSVNRINLSGSSDVSNVVDKFTGGDLSSISSKVKDENTNSDTDSCKAKVATDTTLASDAFTSSVPSGSGRSKSVLADPIANILALHSIMPTRSKTAMGEPMGEFDSFDPLATSGNSPKKAAWLSNEDLINETFGSGTKIEQDGNMNNNNSEFNRSNGKTKAVFDDFANFSSSAKNNNNVFGDLDSGFPTKTAASDSNKNIFGDSFSDPFSSSANKNDFSETKEGSWADSWKT